MPTCLQGLEQKLQVVQGPRLQVFSSCGCSQAGKAKQGLGARVRLLLAVLLTRSGNTNSIISSTQHSWLFNVLTRRCLETVRPIFSMKLSLTLRSVVVWSGFRSSQPLYNSESMPAPMNTAPSTRLCLDTIHLEGIRITSGQMFMSLRKPRPFQPPASYCLIHQTNEDQLSLVSPGQIQRDYTDYY